ncbi:hypothetical protein [Pseudalkalibacillus sp. SCS-8]|uniref:hypothetical protein n=1 Tax=Pseudalkalibacillus nanhaiensis TaxID=3115291 RepID=UPI0032DB8C01
MDSRDKENKISKEVLRQFKEAQIAAWIGDEDYASKKFEKSIKAINLLPTSLKTIFAPIEVVAKSHPLKKDNQTEELKDEVLIKNKFNHKLKYSFTFRSRDRAELRAKLGLSQKRIMKYYKILDRRQQLTSTNIWEWQQYNPTLGFTAYYIFTFSDSTIYGEITTHTHLDEKAHEKIINSILLFIEDKLESIIT